jgi:hypothetical protein
MCIRRWLPALAVVTALAPWPARAGQALGTFRVTVTVTRSVRVPLSPAAPSQAPPAPSRDASLVLVTPTSSPRVVFVDGAPPALVLPAARDAEAHNGAARSPVSHP